MLLTELQSRFWGQTTRIPKRPPPPKTGLQYYSKFCIRPVPHLSQVRVPTAVFGVVTSRTKNLHPLVIDFWKFFVVLLRGTVVNRTYGTHKNLYI